MWKLIFRIFDWLFSIEARRTKQRVKAMKDQCQYLGNCYLKHNGIEEITDDVYRIKDDYNPSVSDDGWRGWVTYCNIRLAVYLILEFSYNTEKKGPNGVPTAKYLVPIADPESAPWPFPGMEKYKVSEVDPVTIYKKAVNLSMRFGEIIIDLQIRGERFFCEYYLGYEKKTFEAYYKNNNLKKKLNGALAFVTELEMNLDSLVSSVNTYYENFGSKLKLSYCKTSQEPFKLHHFILWLNDYEIANTKKEDYNLVEAYTSLKNLDIETKLKSLASLNLIKINVNDKIIICHAMPKVSNGFMVFKPLFPVISAEAILSTTAFVVETFSARTSHHGSVSVSNL